VGVRAAVAKDVRVAVGPPGVLLGASVKVRVDETVATVVDVDEVVVVAVRVGVGVWQEPTHRSTRVLT
jgi:hypothetical protein